ncbi:SUMO-interacting motif-containing protein 1 isoform X2 [Brienomyrus brachyistius]|uniref:SUMO-interacting motif-containing protein 1 isoform X2 n=1 Tax=Brienomyrus brachyistius TaxID=42636 RepID=UPI0020B245FF|nr:SUMO-interacting motif-containing protein 1 isoform X2 [Brienomyrus brachyistius]
MEDIIFISSGEDSDVESRNGSVMQNEQSRYSPVLLIDLTDSRWASSQKQCRNHYRNPPKRFVPDLREYKPRRFMMDPCPAQSALEEQEKTPKYLMSLTEGSGLNYPCRATNVSLSAEDLSRPVHFSKITGLCHNFASEARDDGKTRNQVSDVSWKCPEKSYYCPASPSTISQWSSRSPSLFSLSEGETAARPLTSGGHSSHFPTGPSAPPSPSCWHSSGHMQDIYTETKVEANDSQIPQMHELKQEDSLESGFPDYTSDPSPAGSYSPYYCPSVIDQVEFSDISSLYDEHPDEVHSPSPGSDHPHAEGLSGTYEIGDSGDGQLGNLGPSLEPFPVSPGTAPPKSSQAIGCLSPALADAPDDFRHTSTDIIARGSSDWLADGVELPVESSFSSLSLPRTPSFFPDPGEDWSPHCTDSCTPSSMRDACKEEMEAKTEREPGIDCRYVSPARLKRLRNPLWRSSQIQAKKDDKGDEKKGEEEGCREALCRRSLSLVNTTIEEDFPEGTLQLLADFLHPRVCPPPQITSHLLRGILLNCQCPIALVSEAYTLLTRTQKYHPADRSSVPWDWELLCSVMNEQQKPGWYMSQPAPKDPSKRHQSSVVRMLLQYVLQTLEDDFHLQMSQHSLFSSIASATLSCDRRFSCVRDAIGWLVYAVKNSTGDPQRKSSDTEEEMLKEQDENLKVVFLLQRMLNLALEVDRSPTCSSNKISQELFQTLIGIVPLRKHRLLLLETLDSSLLRCKVLELLLQNSCLLKSTTPMSLKLLLHFFQNALPTTDPTDGAMKCSSWNELVQLLWMLLLSYEEVKEGHLRVSITERARYTRPPIQTVNDQITRAAVQEAAEDFRSRLSADLGPSVPPQLENLFSSLLGYLLDACQ